MIAVAGTTSAVALLLTLKQPGTSVAGASSQAGGAPPAASAPAGSGAVPAGGETVLGEEADTQFGPVQVELTLSDGRITAARAVKVPSTDANSRKIAADAVPKLNQAALAAQSAGIDAVSGATYTSEGYIRSLQSALDKAGTGEGAGQGTPAGGNDGAPGGDGSGGEPGTGEGSGSGSGSAQDSGAGQGSGSGSGSDENSGSAGTESVLGDVAGTQYGDVQVRLTVSGGRITAAEAVRTPDSDANSRKIAANAVPKLNQAVLTAQSAGIDAVSGATYTSEGYIRSLQSALDKAGL
ncbi:FMN-binding protein [Streptomyces wuyuanensis]|uniref:FMN-binding protein n=1 Tax=Streptomyces wuyuanensis TaxID=1196353 RepID=UPI0037F286D3